MQTFEIRNEFLKFFENKNHKIFPSSDIIPNNDPSLLFSNAGMVQFKNWFLGHTEPHASRVTTSQKCLRAGGKHNDLENVGYTKRHHTLFEMLGNFSFSNYFKEEAILYAWEFLTRILELPENKLYITVYQEDEEAYKLWTKISGLDASRIIKINSEDNFWSMGNTGPAGPCSEIFFDHGEQYSGSLPSSFGDDTGDRYVEIWNLVFMQYQKNDDGTMSSLGSQHIDTGMGLERITAVLQGQNDNYEIDVFRNIINIILQKLPLFQKQIIPSHKVIADHIRAIGCLVAEGLVPNNTGREYVLRRIIRRAIRHAYNLGAKEPILHSLISPAFDILGNYYQNVIDNMDSIESIIQNEEISFFDTLHRGMGLLNQELDNFGKLSGKTAFKLYDTYGFPIDLTEDILREKNISFNRNEFEKEMEIQKNRSKQNWAGSGDDEIALFDIASQAYETKFVGYDLHEVSNSKITHIQEVSLKDNEIIYYIACNKTPFYAESGGQVGDTGIIKTANAEGSVMDTIYLSNVHIHKVKIINGSLQKGDLVNLVIDIERRKNIQRNHTVTHILHKILQNTLGRDATQKGSLVTDSYLRFDFSTNKEVDIYHIENQVNDIITQNLPVTMYETSLEEAKTNGVMAIFGEKYGHDVRVISIGEFVFSAELCGGTHVSCTGEIGYFTITSSSSIASGVRRIEAKTGSAAIEDVQLSKQIVTNLSQSLKTPSDNIENEVFNLVSKKKELEKELGDLRDKYILSSDKVKKYDIGQHSIAQIFLKDEYESKNTRALAQKAGDLANCIVVSNLSGNNNLSIVIGSRIENISAKDILAELANLLNIRAGGGNAKFAQTGGVIEGEYNLEYLENAIQAIFNKLR